MKHWHWAPLYLGGAALVGATFLDPPHQATLIVGLLLLLPLFDNTQRPSQLGIERWFSREFWVVLGVLLAMLLWKPSLFMVAVSTFLAAAFPEEWYFRRYLCAKMGFSFRAIVISSVFFSLLHGLVWSWVIGLAVFVPSIIFGLVYRKTRDFGVIVLLHTLANVIFHQFQLERYLISALR